MSKAGRVVALDIDGTLVTASGNLPIDNIKAINSAVRNHAQVVLMTARTVDGAREVVQRLGVPVSLVAELGAVVVSSEGQVVTATHLERTSASFLLSSLTSGSFDYVCTVEGVNYGSSEKVLPKTGKRGGMLSLSSIDLAKVSRVVVRNPSRDEILTIVRSAGDLSVAFGASSPGSSNDDAVIVRAGVSKLGGLQRLLTRWKVPLSAVVAVGDSEWDVDVISAAGIGVVMAAAEPGLKMIADWIAPPAENAGLAEALRRFGFAENS